MKDLKCTCHLNQAACADKQGKSEECIAQCNKALEIRGSNVKALFRRGKTYAARARPPPPRRHRPAPAALGALRAARAAVCAQSIFASRLTVFHSGWVSFCVASVLGVFLRCVWAECFSALRAGQALGQLDEATKDLKQVLALDPANKAAEKQLALVRQKQRVQDSKDKVPPPPRRPCARAARTGAPAGARARAG